MIVIVIIIIIVTMKIRIIILVMILKLVINSGYPSFMETPPWHLLACALEPASGCPAPWVWTHRLQVRKAYKY